MRVLVTGATGYVGARLIPVLLDRGHEVVAAARDVADLTEFAWADQVEAVRYDVESTPLVQSATSGVDAVIYLVHSMEGDDFVAKDRHAAERVSRACADNGVARLVYLSGLIPDERPLSAHLSSRLQVEEIFLEGPVPALVLRASMIIGAGSTSFEMLKRMSERVPFTPIPRYLRGPVQPIAIEDVVELLAESLDRPAKNEHLDIGGPSIVSYAELLALFAELDGLRRRQVVVPVAPRWAVSRIVARVSGLPRGTVTALVDSLSHPMVCHTEPSWATTDHEYTGLRESIERSLTPHPARTAHAPDIQSPAPTDIA